MSHDILLDDLHVHSTFSDDAVSTLQENVDAAAAAGLRRLRLVDHVRRDTAWVPEFAAAVAALDAPDGLEILTGVEAKILDRAGALDAPPLPPGIDRVLIADHQFPGADGPLPPSSVRELRARGWTDDDVLDHLVDALVAVMRRHPGNQLAHCFSLLPKIGLDERALGEERLAAWASTARATDTIVELNEKWACPGVEAIRHARAAGVELAAATDSHVASDVGRYRRVAELLAGLGA